MFLSGLSHDDARTTAPHIVCATEDEAAGPEPAVGDLALAIPMALGDACSGRRQRQQEPPKGVAPPYFTVRLIENEQQRVADEIASLIDLQVVSEE
jgi:hypothetical protein